MPGSNALRQQRIHTYAQQVHKVPTLTKPMALAMLQRGIPGVTLNIPDKSNRLSNFKRLVKENFHMQGDPFESTNGWPENYTSLQPYETFKQYGMTDYGAMMIQHVLRTNKTSHTRFQISLGSATAEGNENRISFPTDFGTKGTGGYVNRFGGDGQPIDYLAIIHHEFRHTRFWGKKKREYVDLYGERDAVIYNENPVRIINDFEPRYSYFSAPKGQTINIITRIIKAGKWGVRADDPRQFAMRGSKDALSQPR